MSRGFHSDDDLCGNKNGHDEGGVFYVLNPQYADKPLCKKQFYEIKEYKMKTIDEIFWLRNDFCKTVFLTGEEAEAKLKELRGAEGREKKLSEIWILSGLILIGMNL